MDSTSAAILSAWATTAAAIATAVAAWYTAKSANRNADMVEEMRAARQPAVFLDLEIPASAPAVLVIGNNGDAPARSIHFELEDSLPWDLRGKAGVTPNELPAVRSGIPYLAPGRTLRFDLRVLDWTEESERRAWLNAVIKYKGGSGREFESRANINLARYNHVTTDTFTAADREIAAVLRDFLWRAHDKDALERAQESGRTWCPACAKLIPSSAKKCHWCGEWVKSEPSPG